MALFSRPEPHQSVMAAAAEVGLQPGSLRALLSLDDAQPMRDLAGDLQCDASYVTALADDVEQSGFVERTPSPTDRRVKLLVLTAEGDWTTLLADAITQGRHPTVQAVIEAVTWPHLRHSAVAPCPPGQGLKSQSLHGGVRR